MKLLENNKVLLSAIYILASIFLLSCDKDDNKTLAFIGDSIVARWDAQECFPAYQTSNYGKGGEGIDYVKSLSGKMRGKTVIVMFGTNDISKSDTTYPDDYINSISNLGASDIYLFCILPRCNKNETMAINSKISNMNASIKELALQRGWHYIDVYDKFLTDDGDLKWEYYTDGVHLSDQAYMLLTSELRKVLR